MVRGGGPISYVEFKNCSQRMSVFFSLINYFCSCHFFFILNDMSFVTIFSKLQSHVIVSRLHVPSN